MLIKKQLWKALVCGDLLGSKARVMLWASGQRRSKLGMGVRGIAKDMGAPYVTVRDAVDALVKQGALRRNPVNNRWEVPLEWQSQITAKWSESRPVRVREDGRKPDRSENRPPPVGKPTTPPKERKEPKERKNGDSQGVDVDVDVDVKHPDTTDVKDKTNGPFPTERDLPEMPLRNLTENELFPEIKTATNGRKETDPRVRVFIDFAYDQYRTVHGLKLRVNGNQDGSLIKAVLKERDIEELKQLWVAFLKTNDAFYRKCGYSIGLFVKNINGVELAAGKGRSEYERYE